MGNTGYAHRGVYDERESHHREEDLRETVRAIRAGNTPRAIFSLQRALGSDTEAARVVENEWRRK